MQHMSVDTLISPSLSLCTLTLQGCGVAMPATYRIVTENTVWAMPECSIGFHADVGANYYLSRVHHNIGVMLGLTGHRLNASDCMYCSLGTHFMQSANIPPFMVSRIYNVPVFLINALWLIMHTSIHHRMNWPIWTCTPSTRLPSSKLRPCWTSMGPLASLNKTSSSHFRSMRTL